MPERNGLELGRVQTLSLIAGCEACDARCPFCVSKMTPNDGIAPKPEKIDFGRLQRAYTYAAKGYTDTCIITGKGEPTLHPEHITQYLNELLRAEKHTGFKINRKELQTNGITIADGKRDDILYVWRAAGLETVAVSVVGHDPEVNKKIYLPYRDSYIDLPSLVTKLHDANFAVRLSCVLIRGGIDSATKLKEFIEFAKDHNVEEVTIRPVNRPEDSRNPGVAHFVDENALLPEQLEDINRFLQEHGTVVRTFPFGGTVYSIFDIRRQNVCSTTSLTKDVNPKNFLRQLIFYPGGRIATDWTEKGEGLK